MDSEWIGTFPYAPCFLLASLALALLPLLLLEEADDAEDEEALMPLPLARLRETAPLLLRPPLLADTEEEEEEEEVAAEELPAAPPTDAPGMKAALVAGGSNAKKEPAEEEEEEEAATSAAIRLAAVSCVAARQARKAGGMGMAAMPCASASRSCCRWMTSRCITEARSPASTASHHLR